MSTRLSRNKLLATTLFAGVAGSLWYGSAIAQETTDESDTVIVVEEVDEDSDVSIQEKVVVTGSRLARDEYTSISPVQVIQADVARAAGLISAEDILGTSTASSGQRVDATFNGFVLDNGPGSSEVNLRGLGSNRTLLLVNGRRLAPAGVEGAPSAGDISLVPSILLSRVEVLLDGASSVYGADAVSGVANAILRTDIDGFEVEGEYSVPFAGGGNETTLSAAWGQNNESGHIGFAAEFYDRNSVAFRQRDFTEDCDREVFINPDNGDGVVGDCKLSLINRIYLPAGFGSIYYTPGDSNIGIPNFSESQVSLGDADGDGLPDIDISDPFYNRNASNMEAATNLISPQQRYSMYAFGEYDLGFDTNTSVFFEALYSNRKGSINSGPGYLQFTVPGDNPYNPCNQTSNPDGVNCFGEVFGANLGDYPVFTINTIRGDRARTEYEVAQSRFVAGMKGDLPGVEAFGLNNWTYELSGQYSHSSGQSTREGILNDRMQLSLNTSYRDPATGVVSCGIDLNGDGVPDDGAIGIFGDEYLETVPCVPVNMFAPSIYQEGGGTFATQAERDYLFGTRTFNTIVDQSIFQGIVQGDVFTLPWNGAKVPLLVGFEYRDESLDSQPDNVAREGLLNGFFADKGAKGRRDLWEAFTETEFTLLRGLPGAEELTVNGSARWTEEENFGALWTYSGKLKYRPVEWLALNSTYGTSYRAPGLREQFLRGSTGFNSYTDPCVVPNDARRDDDGDLSTPEVYDPTQDQRSPQTLANCTASGVDPLSLGLADGIGPSQSLEITTGGSDNLQAEESDSFTYGFTLEQPWYDSFDLSFNMTYYDIEITDSVIEPSPAFIIRDCYVDNPDLQSAFCNRLTRSAGGYLTDVDASFINIGRETAKGFDFNMRYGQEFIVGERPLDLSVDLRANKTEERIVDLSNTLAPDASPAEVAASIDENKGETDYPEWRANATVIADYRDFTLVWQTRFIQGGQEDRSSTFDPTATDNPVDFTDDYFLHSVSLGYNANSWRVTLGIENLFDEEPPVIDTDGVFGVRNVPFGVGYDVLGRRAFLQVAKSF
nr:TonB-dependent receptor [uncultured Hyphomonas sp.]